MNNALVWRPRITLADATQRRLWENLRDFRDVSEETSLINLQGDVSEICKSTLFEMSLRRFMRRLRDASEIHPCPLGRRFGHCKQEKHQIFVQQKTIFLNFHETKDYFFDLIIKTKSAGHNISALEKLQKQSPKCFLWTPFEEWTPFEKNTFGGLPLELLK